MKRDPLSKHGIASKKLLMVAYFFYSLCEQIVTFVRQKSNDPVCAKPQNSLPTSSMCNLTPPPPIFSVSTGAAPPVSVATVHRHGAEDGGDKEVFQAQE